MPRAIQSVSASRSNVKAHAARAPPGQRGADVTALSRRGGGRSPGPTPDRDVPDNLEPELEPAGHFAKRAASLRHLRVRGRPAGYAELDGGLRARLLHGRERLDEGGIEPHSNVVRIKIGLARTRDLPGSGRREDLGEGHALLRWRRLDLDLLLLSHGGMRCLKQCRSADQSCDESRDTTHAAILLEHGARDQAAFALTLQSTGAYDARRCGERSSRRSS